MGIVHGDMGGSLLSKMLYNEAPIDIDVEGAEAGGAAAASMSSAPAVATGGNGSVISIVRRNKTETFLTTFVATKSVMTYC